MIISLDAIGSVEEESQASSPPNLTERRSKSRYPMELGVRFRLRFRKVLLSGEGRTVNLSARGLLITSQELASLQDEITAGARLEISIDWPVLLDGRTRLQLLARGRVVRRGEIDFAVIFDRHEFRTRRSVSAPAVHAGEGGIPWPLTDVTFLD
jgi:hypothetical protein